MDFCSTATIFSPQVPLAIFGVISLLAALLVTFMPETSNTPLPDTIMVFDYDDNDDGVEHTYLLNLKEGEQLGKGDTFWSGFCTRRRKNDTTQ